MSGLVLAIAFVVLATPAVPRAQGGIPALQTRVQALEKAVTALRGALNDLTARTGTLSAALQAHIATVSTQLSGFQQLLAQFNQALSSAETDIVTLEGKVAALEQALAALAGGVASYDGLAGGMCTTAVGTSGTVHLTGLLKSPVCTAGISVDGRFFDLGPVIFDARTNLLWEKKTSAPGGGNSKDPHDVNNVYSWCVATGSSSGECDGNQTSWIGEVNAEGFAGFTNWRVPTLEELKTIADASLAGCGSGKACIDPIFGATQVAFYWSSTEVEIVDVMSWGVDFFDTFVARVDKSSEHQVRAVRSAL
jgi:uncharacterized protein YoxC